MNKKHDVIYFGKCPEKSCTDNYLGESAKRIYEEINGRHQKSQLFRHAVVNDHRNASYDDFMVRVVSRTTRLKETFFAKTHFQMFAGVLNTSSHRVI